MLLLYGISNENWADEEILAGLARSLDSSQLTSMGTLKVRSRTRRLGSEKSLKASVDIHFVHRGGHGNGGIHFCHLEQLPDTWTHSSGINLMPLRWQLT